MTTPRLNKDVEMHATGLGVFQTPAEETREAVTAALAASYRHIDTAAAYGNEREVGEAVRDSGCRARRSSSRRRSGSATTATSRHISLESFGLPIPEA